MRDVFITVNGDYIYVRDLLKGYQSVMKGRMNIISSNSLFSLQVPTFAALLS